MKRPHGNNDPDLGDQGVRFWGLLVTSGEPSLYKNWYQKWGSAIIKPKLCSPSLGLSGRWQVGWKDSNQWLNI